MQKRQTQKACSVYLKVLCITKTLFVKVSIMDILQELLQQFDWETVVKTCLRIALMLILTWIAFFIANRFIDRVKGRIVHKSKIEGEPPSETEKRLDTITRLIRQAITLVIGVTALLIILREIGFEIGPILASAGVLGLAVGFGAQNLVRDVISGFFIILENQIRVNDVAVINGTGGLVERINFRTTVLRDLSGTVHIFPNGTISTLSNVTNNWSAYVFDIGVAYKENTDKVVDVIKEVAKSLEEDEEFGALIIEPIEIFGVDKLADSSVVIKGRIKTKPIRQWGVGREFLRRIKLAFDEKGIEIPFPHQTLYFGEDSKPFDVALTEKLQKQGNQ